MHLYLSVIKYSLTVFDKFEKIYKPSLLSRIACVYFVKDDDVIMVIT